MSQNKINIQPPNFESLNPERVEIVISKCNGLATNASNVATSVVGAINSFANAAKDCGVAVVKTSLSVASSALRHPKIAGVGAGVAFGLGLAGILAIKGRRSSLAQDCECGCADECKSADERESIDE